MHLYIRFLAVACLVGAWIFRDIQFPSSARGGTKHKKSITPALSKYIEDNLRKNNIPGLALGVFHADGETEYGAWGNRTEDGDAMTTDTLFILGSLSKAFVSASIGILMDDYAYGRNVTPLPAGMASFNWDTRIKDLLPGDWKLMDDFADSKASFKDILSHTSGLSRHDFSYGPRDSAKDVVQKMRYLRPTFELRDQFSYNNQFFMLGSHLISRYTGSYAQFVQDRIFDPLNMTSTTWSPSKAEKSGKLTQSWASFGRRIPTWFTDESAELQNGPGSLMSNVEDLEKWVRTLMNGGVDPRTNVTIIPREALDAATTVRTPINGRGSTMDSITGYGLGWARFSYHGHDVIIHNGLIPGISTSISYLPHEGLGIVALTNTDGQRFPIIDLPRRIIRDTLGLVGPATDDLPILLPSVASSFKKPPQPHAIASSGGPPLALDAYAGTYSNPGYGTLALCAPASTSQYCSQVLAEFRAVDARARWSAQFNGTAQLFAAWERVWCSHVRLMHVAAHRFAMYPTTLFPAGYGKNTTPFETGEQMVRDLGDVPTAEFVVGADGRVVGVGLNGLGNGQEAREGAVKETAEVWFEKV